MTTLTSSLPEGLLNQLNEQAIKLSIPKNEIVEKALRICLDQINRAEYVASYRQAGEDQKIMKIAEEGMVEYMHQLE